MIHKVRTAVAQGARVEASDDRSEGLAKAKCNRCLLTGRSKYFISCLRLYVVGNSEHNHPDRNMPCGSICHSEYTASKGATPHLA